MSRIASVIFLVCSAALTAAGVENPSVGSRAGSPTSVPSANRGGLIPNRENFSPNAGNLGVTGNIGGGRHFRGVVPYGSSFYSQAELVDAGSGSVDAFLRRSANPLGADRGPGVYESYFQPSRAVTSLPRIGRPELLNPYRWTEARVNPAEPANLPQTNMTPFSRQRLFSPTSKESERILSRQIDRQMLEKTQSKDNPLITGQSRQLPLELPLEKILLPRTKDSPAQPGQIQVPVAGEADLAQKYLEIRDRTLESLKDPETSDKKPDTTKAQTADKKADLPGAADKAIPAEYKTGEYKTYESLARSRFGQYMVLAQQLLSEGKFYLAADSFALAAVWEPELGQPYMGQAVALFAAGEYMSSAYYLGRAFVLEPMLAGTKIDLAKLIPDRDTFESRLVEMETWQKRSGSGELAFMMAWVLWQDGKDVRARQSLQEAAKIMAQDEAVKILLSAMEHPAVDGDKSNASAVPAQPEPAQKQQENSEERVGGQP